MSDTTVLRRFNRTYTARIGVLDDSFLDAGRPLGEARLLFEIGGGQEGADEDGVVIADLRRRLGLDSGYLSRLLRRLERDTLVEVVADPVDARRRRVRLLSAGQAAWDDLDRRSEVLAQRIVNGLDPRRRAALTESLATAERLVRIATVTIEPVDPAGDEAQHALARYFAELDERFVGGFDPGTAAIDDAPAYRAPSGRFLVARSDDDVIACGAVADQLDPQGRPSAEIKRMWVAPDWRGSGIGGRMLGALERTAAEIGYVRVVLDTNAVLAEAITMYGRSGYEPIERYNDNPYAQLWFTKALAPAVRPFTDDDAAGFAQLVLGIQQGEFGLGITLADQPDLADPEATFRDAGGELWVAVHGGEVVGSVGVLRPDAHHAVLRKMFVRADHRGTGLAAQLLDTAISWSTTAGCRRLLLGTTAVMHAAQRFYTTAGFRRLEPDELPPSFPRMAVDSAFFARDLR